MDNKGLVHIYAGEGKGKTTASFGLALRAYGQGKKVIVYQFLKSKDISCGEIKAIKKLNQKLDVIRFNQIHPCFKQGLKGRRLEEYIDKLKKQINEDFNAIKENIKKTNYDLVILDELVNVVSQGYIDENNLLDFINTKSAKTELVLTGREATDNLLKVADYVTYMKDVKHPFKEGKKAREGIEY